LKSFGVSKYFLKKLKVTVKTVLILQKKKYVSNKLCSFELYKKHITVSTKILSSTTVFNIDDNMFLEQQISIL